MNTTFTIRPERAAVILAVTAAHLFAGGALAIAGGIISELPKDGTWARFDMQYQRLDSEGVVRQTVPGSFRVGSVGRVDVDGLQSRWIQLDYRQTFDDGKEHYETRKLLITESSFVADANPLDHVKRAWERLGEAGRSTEVKEFGIPFRIALSPVFHGRLQQVTVLENETVETRLGRLDCSGFTGKQTVGAGGVEDGIFAYETRLHRVAPFGVVKHRCELTGVRDGKPTGLRRAWTFTLVDSGDNAKATIP